MTSTPNSNRVMEEHKVKVRNIDIHYTKVGCGHHAVLLLPGFLGTASIDFGNQLTDLCVDGLTLIAWDGPGCGKSRPPDKVVKDGYLKEEADYARDMMLAIGYSTFSLVGYCNGGIIALELAAAYPENVRRLLTIGSKAFYTQQDVEAIRSIHRFEYQAKWRQLDLLTVYDVDYVNHCWGELMNFVERTFTCHDGDLCRAALPRIRAPTLIVHADRDRIVSTEHGVYLHKHISGSKLKIMADANHVSHMRHPGPFNAVIENFLANKEPFEYKN